MTRPKATRRERSGTILRWFGASKPPNEDTRASRYSNYDIIILSSYSKEHPLSALEKRPQRAYIRYGFDSIDRLDQSFRFCAPQDRSGEIARFFDDFGARHRVARRPAHGFHAFGESGSIRQFDFDNRDAHRQEPGKLFVSHEIHFRPLAQRVCVLHARLVVRGLKRDGFVEQHYRYHVLQADVGDVAVVDDLSNGRSEAHGNALHRIGHEGLLGANGLDRVEGRLDR